MIAKMDQRMRNIDGDEQQYVRRQYQTQHNLNVRIRTHEIYGVPQIDFAAWVLDRVSWHGHERVIDVGCGSGMYAEPTRARAGHYLAGDLSLGMLQKLEQPGLARVNLNAQAIPLADNTADLILANHMLYHVPDQETALREFVRVLRPAGRLLAATNSAQNMEQFRALSRQALALLGAGRQQESSITTFTLENGRELLQRYFRNVERHDLPGALVFPDPEPVIAYLGSSRERFVRALPAGRSWEDVVAVLERILSTHIAEHGDFRVNKLTGVFVCDNQ